MELDRTLLFFLILLIPLSLEAFTIRDVVLNGSFEEGLAEDGERPLWWYIGFPGDPPITSLGDWHLDSATVGEGEVSLHIVTHCADTESYVLVQFIDAPTFDLEGKTVSLSLRLKHGGIGGGNALLFAYNPESTDSMLGLIPVSGYTIISSDPADTGFSVYADSFVATGPAEILALMLLVEGWAGEVWFDDIQAVYDVAEAGDGPDTSEVPDMLSGEPREFYLGVVAELPRNNSERAFLDLPAEIAEVGDIENIFAHVQWNALRGQPLLTGHEVQLQYAEGGRELGLERMLTFDFTHNNALTVGEINPYPDGTPVDSLSPEVRAAYIDELMALVEEIDPIIVSIGVETSIFHRERPDQWGNYVRLMEEARDALTVYPHIHVTAYFVLTQMVDIWGNFDSGLRAAWEEIMPYCESVAYSYYSLAGGMAVIPENYFIIPKDIAPEKPLLIPEFGCRSDESAGYDDDLQFEVTQEVISQVASTEPPPVAICWYQMYDVQYLDAPVWFRAFSSIGLRHFDWTPKKVHAGFRKMLARGTGIEENPIIPDKFDILCYPNPFNGAISIEIAGVGTDYNLSVQQNQIEIYDINGRLVFSFFSPFTQMNLGCFLTSVTLSFAEWGKQSFTRSVGESVPDFTGTKEGWVAGSGTHIPSNPPTHIPTFSWTPEPSLPSGVYFIRANDGKQKVCKKVIYLK
ncbi:T9SS type A sorting domain-containing protein [bacterium]|nr:T9SS type A sorting domain-containing protein [bacterium]